MKERLRKDSLNQRCRQTRVLANDNTLIQFTADKTLIEKLEKLRGLLAHKNFDGNYAKLFEILADIALKKLNPGMRSERRPKPRMPKPHIEDQKPDYDVTVPDAVVIHNTAPLQPSSPQAFTPTAQIFPTLEKNDASLFATIKMQSSMQKTPPTPEAPIAFDTNSRSANSRYIRPYFLPRRPGSIPRWNIVPRYNFTG